MKKIGSVLGNVLAIVLSLFWLFPVYIVVVNSFKNRAELYESMLALPEKFNFEYYVEAMDKMNFTRAFTNSLVVTIISILFIVVLASMTAWMLVRKRCKLSTFIFNLFILTMLIPFQTLMMPLMQEMGWIRDNLGLPMLDNLGGLVYMYIGWRKHGGIFVPRLYQDHPRKPGGGSGHRRLQQVQGFLADCLPHAQAHHHDGDYSGRNLDLE